MKARLPARRKVLRESFERLCEWAPELRSRAVQWRLIVVVAAGVATLVPALCWVRGDPWRATAVEGLYLLWCGRYMLWGFFEQRERYRAIHGEQAYAHLFLDYLVPFLAGAGPVIVFPALVSGPRLLPSFVALLAGAYLLATALLMERRAPEIFWNVELRGFVFTVFPERGEVIQCGLYEYLRHPIYSCIARFALGLALLRNNLPALVCAMMLCGGLWLMARTEELDLVARQPSYVAYRDATPGFVVRRPGEFFRYLLGSDEGA
ncbi:MAG: hypothetical protein HYU66_05995 [Armatimonadetes bacterium]|nr:hypothetical protein [Armatimonadota bacterium]